MTTYILWLPAIKDYVTAPIKSVCFCLLYNVTYCIFAFHRICIWFIMPSCKFMAWDDFSIIWQYGSLIKCDYFDTCQSIHCHKLINFWWCMDNYTTDMSKSVQYRGVQYFPYIARIWTGLLLIVFHESFSIKTGINLRYKRKTAWLLNIQDFPNSVLPAPASTCQQRVR